MRHRTYPFVCEVGDRCRFYDILFVGHDEWKRYVLLAPDPMMMRGTIPSRGEIHKQDETKKGQYDDQIIEVH